MKKLLSIIAVLVAPVLLYAQDLKNYAGTYTFQGAPFAKVLVTAENGKLFGFEEESGKHELKGAGKTDTYAIEGIDGQVIFKRNGKIVEKVSVVVEGQSFEGKRVFPALKEFTGIFLIEGAPFDRLVLTEESGALVADAPGVGKGPLQPTSNLDEFYEPANDAVIGFVRDAKGVTDLIISVQGAQLSGKKQVVAANEYAGKYVFSGDSPINEVVVEFKDGKLFGNSDQGTAELKATSVKDEYELVGYDGKAVFKRDSTQKISGLILFVQGFNLEALKK